MMCITESGDRKFLGIEGGGTRTVALLVNAQGQQVKRVESGPSNLKLMCDTELAEHFCAVAATLPRPNAVAIGLAGAWAESDWARIRTAAAKAWPLVPCHATNDLETALAAAESRTPLPQVLLLSGTGSCCFGKDSAGRTAKVGGWGHLLGDRGSGYDIALSALQRVADDYDRKDAWSRLGALIIQTLQLSEPNQLIDWAHGASKGDIAALCEVVFAAAAEGDRFASELVRCAAGSLAQDGASCAAKLAKKGGPVQFVLAGGLLLKQPRFLAQVKRELARLWPGAVVTPLTRESVWGAVELAKRGEEENQRHVSKRDGRSPGFKAPEMREDEVVTSSRLSPTEERNPLSMDLDKLPLADAVELMLSEDAKVPGRILAEKGQLVKAVAAIARAFKGGGRLFYAGAGTSGRLGVLDASECPPTFSVPVEMVQGIMAGGHTALWKGIEGAEDDGKAGASAIHSRGVGKRDVVVGIAASGTTPFVWGALQEAKSRRATTILVCFNPFLRIPPALRPNVVVAPNLGPELLTGSTRLKAGTATKLVLNLFTTLAMVRLGKVVSNLMVDVQATNVKLRDRATRIVRELTGADYAAAQAALESSGWVVKKAVSRLQRKAAKGKQT